MTPTIDPDTETCHASIPGFFADGLVSAVCLRPVGHEGNHWPVPYVGDFPREDDDA